MSLSANARLVRYVLIDLGANDGVSVTRREIQEAAALSRSSVGRALAELQLAGLLAVRATTGAASHYQLIPQGHTEPGSQGTQGDVTESPDLSEPGGQMGLPTVPTPTPPVSEPVSNASSPGRRGRIPAVFTARDGRKFASAKRRNAVDWELQNEAERTQAPESTDAEGEAPLLNFPNTAVEPSQPPSTAQPWDAPLFSAIWRAYPVGLTGQTRQRPGKSPGSPRGFSRRTA